MTAGVSEESRTSVVLIVYMYLSLKPILFKLFTIIFTRKLQLHDISYMLSIFDYCLCFVIVIFCWTAVSRGILSSQMSSFSRAVHLLSLPSGGTLFSRIRQFPLQCSDFVLNYVYICT